MTKRLSSFLLLFLICAVVLFSSFQIGNVEATTFTDTRTFSSLTYDGVIEREGTNYATEWSASQGSTKHDALDHGVIGQAFALGEYYICRSFVFFDTSIIPSTATITSATLSLYIPWEDTPVDFNVTIQRSPTFFIPHTPLLLVDYYYMFYGGDGGSRSTSTLTLYQYWNITLNSNGCSWIQKDAVTKFCLRSSRDINGNAPATTEIFDFSSSEAGSSYAPKLYVTYETEGYRYIVHGPYYENGNVYANTVNVTLYRQNDEPYKFVLNGAGGADTETIDTEQRGWYFAWNISSVTYNQTRIYYLTSASFEELWIYIPNPDQPFEMYFFTVTDFAGITNGYLESRINVAGQNRVVERQKLDVIGAVPFWMTWANRYDIHLTCDQGGYTWGGFVALTETSQSLIITRDMFPAAYPGMDVTVNALRKNATWIQINYTDNQLLTDWVQITIKYREAMTWRTSYTTNNTGDTQQIDWYLADATIDYVTTVTASRNGEPSTWSFSCPKPAVATNPWEGLLDVLGTWPIPASNVFGLAIVLCVFGVFSYASMEIGCVLGVLMAMFLAAIGWLQISWTLLAFALVIAVFVALQRGKSREREV